MYLEAYIFPYILFLFMKILVYIEYIYLISNSILLTKNYIGLITIVNLRYLGLLDV